jgi:hypothetical protein
VCQMSEPMRQGVSDGFEMSPRCCKVARKLESLARYVEAKGAPGWPAERSESDICVVGNAIPKSGTYLLKEISKYLGLWTDTGIHILDRHYFQFRDGCDTLRIPLCAGYSLKKLQPGQLVAAHVHHHPAVATYFSTHPSARHIFMYRDPRDTFVSYARFLTYSKNVTHWSGPRVEQKFYNTYFNNDDDRLSYAIAFLLKRENWHGYMAWRNDPNTFTLRFEDLYPEIVAAADGVFGPTLIGLLEFLGVDALQTDPAAFSAGVLGKGFTASGVTDKVEQYKKTFKDQHFRMLDTDAFRGILELMGYNE